MKTKVQFLIAASVLTVLLTDVNVGLAQQVFNIGGNNLDRWGTTANQNPQTTIRRVGIGDFTAYGGPKAALHVNENLLTDLILNGSNYYTPGHLFRTDGPSDRLNTWRLWTGGQQGGPTATEKGMIFNYGNNPTAADRNNFSIQATAGHLTFHTGTTNADGVAIERMRIVGGTGPTAGFVGIGNNFYAPASLLHLNNNASDTYIQITNNATGTNADDGLRIGIIDNNGTAIINQQEHQSLQFNTSNIPRMLIDADGNIYLFSLASENNHFVIADKNGNLKTANHETIETLLTQSHTIQQLKQQISELKKNIADLMQTDRKN